MSALRDFECPLHGWVCAAPASATVSCGKCRDPRWQGEKPGLHLAYPSGRKRQQSTSPAPKSEGTGQCEGCGGEVLTERFRTGRKKRFCSDACRKKKARG